MGITVIFISQDTCLEICGIPDGGNPEITKGACVGSGGQKALSLAWRKVVREAVSVWSGLSQSQLTFSSDPGGKPHILGPDGKTRLPYQFNASHTKGGVVMALRPDAPVGIDIERRDRRVEWLDLARRYLPAEDLNEILQSSLDAQCTEFIRRWTRLEAILKMQGDGVQKLFNASWKADAHTQFRNTVFLYPSSEFIVCLASRDIVNTPMTLVELLAG